MISCVLIASGRVPALLESLASFLAQDYEDREILVINQMVRQTLVFDHPKVRIFNLKEWSLPMRLKTLAMEHVRGDAVIAWDESSVYLPGFLTQVAENLKDKPWCWIASELCLTEGKIILQQQASEFSFAFKREIWPKVGPYPPGINGACDRQLIGRITQMLPGANTVVHPEAVNLIRIGTREERERIQPVVNCGQIKLQPALTRDYQAMVDISRTGKRESRLCVVQLGRYGDLINVLPIIKHIADNHEKPHVMVSAKFSDVLDGVSYCIPFITQLSNEKLGAAITVARSAFQIVINLGVWGEGHQQKMATPSYGSDAWNNGGFLKMFHDPSVKPVFDRRHPEREAGVIAQLVGDDPGQKPIICVNVKDAISSPCPKCISVLDEIKKVWGDQNLIVDLAGFRAHRIYDLLGLFEISRCLVCVDSAYLHLAQATEIGIVAIKNPKKWAGTIVRRNLAAETDYDKLDMRAIHEGIANCLSCAGNAPHEPQTPRKQP